MSIKRRAYPQLHNTTQSEPYSLEKWQDVALKIKMAGRQYTEYTQAQLVDHFTDEWELKERADFQSWLDYNENGQNHQYKKGQMMTRTAYDFNATRKDDDLKELKKKLRSRVQSAERLLNQMVDEGLLAGAEDKALYIGRILQKLKEEVTLLQKPALIASRHRRWIRKIHSTGLTEVTRPLEQNIDTVASWGKSSLVKTAAELGGVLSAIKEEMDALNYGVHLSTLMGIKSQLEEVGRHSEAGTILDIIKKDLSGLDAVHKKLVEVYSVLAKAPTERREPRQEMPEAPRAEMPRTPQIDRVPSIDSI